MRPAYMMATLSASSSRSERSCVMKITEKLSFSRRRMISVRISRCTTTSSAVVGSSMMRTSGESARAMAIRGDADELKEFDGAAFARIGSHLGTMSTQHVHNLGADRHDGIKRVHGALENNSQLIPANSA